MIITAVTKIAVTMAAVTNAVANDADAKIGGIIVENHNGCSKIAIPFNYERDHPE